MKTRNQIIVAGALVLVAVGVVAVNGMDGGAQDGAHGSHGRARPLCHGGWGVRKPSL